MRRIPKETSYFISSLDRLTFDPFHAKTLTRIIIGLVIVSLTTLLLTLLTTGFVSIWLSYGGVMLAGALIAYLFRLNDRYVAAATSIITTLTVTVAGMLLQPAALTGLGPYLFIPIVIIAGLTLSLPAIIVTAILSIVIPFIALPLTTQLTLPNVIALLPPVSLTIIVTLLTIESSYKAGNFQKMVLDNKKLLRERTWETVEAQRRVKELYQQIDWLKQQVSAASVLSGPADLSTAPADCLFDLINGAIRELDISVQALEHNLEQLEELLATEREQALLAQLWQRIDHLTNLKVNVAELARLEHNDFSLRRQEIDLAALIGEVVGAAQGLARDKNLTLRYRIPAGLPRLYADPERLRQALLRLLTNAVQYTAEGLVEVQVEQQKHELIILVSDTGIGLSSHEAELIFQKFGRARSHGDKLQQGVGLGLAICERLIKLHGGRIWVSSVPGVGSTFYVALPLARPIPANQPVPITTAVTATVTAEETLLAKRALISVASAVTEDDPPPIARPIKVSPPNLGPVARYSSTYTNRFSLILLGLFLLVSMCAAFFAFRFGVAPSEQAASAGPAPTATVTIQTLAPTADQPAALPPTLTNSATPLPSPSPSPAATATVTSSPIVPTVTFTPTPSPLPPTVSPTPLFPTPLVTATSIQVTPITTTPSTSQAQPTALTQPAPAATLPQPRPDSQLAYVTGQAGNFTGARLNLAGSVEPGSVLDIQTIANSGVSWSATGQFLYTTDQTGNREIYVVNPAGGEPQRLTTSIGDNNQPAWSPDGRQIAFSSGRTGNFEIFVMAADGSNPQQLTHSRGFDEWPVWSPDGQQIAFVSDRDGNVEIYLMNADGSEQRRLTNHPADDWPASWSPTGRSLIFSSNRDGNWNLYLLELTGDRLTRLTNDPANERAPAWSPDGQTIALAYDGEGNWDIYSLTLPGSLVGEIPRSAWRQITATPLVDEQHPAWRP